MNNYLLVMIGGGLGAVARYGLSRLLPGSLWPLSTFVANIAGCLLMGCLMGWLLMRGGDTERLRAFFGVGILGGFTTFSAFSYEVVVLLERRDYGVAFGYAAVSVCLSVAAVIAGLMVFRRLGL
ncbi:MAG: fluoride efflux transporter CrcB [Asticcacaulis sp.]